MGWVIWFLVAGLIWLTIGRLCYWVLFGRSLSPDDPGEGITNTFLLSAFWPVAMYCWIAPALKYKLMDWKELLWRDENQRSKMPPPPTINPHGQESHD